MGQAEHYDRILSDYERHYFDAPSMSYRRRFIYQRMFSDLDLNNKRVIELACGSGMNSVECAKLFPRVELTGLDISAESCRAYERIAGRPAVVADLSERDVVLPEPADVAFVVGGLHHCVNDMATTLENVRRLLKPGGQLLMVEPNERFFLNRVRTFWYRKDRWFRAEEEAPLDHELLLQQASPDFELVDVEYLGGAGYFIILNSLILRVPLRVKSLVAPSLFALDDLYNGLPGRAPFPMFIARWRRPYGP